MKITSRLLKSKGACADQIDLFKATFPKGAEPTLENCLKAASAGLDLDWVAGNLLGPEAYEVYYAATAEPRKVYRAATASPWKVYLAATAEAWKVYDAATAEPWKVYLAAEAEARKVYRAATAEALAAAFQVEEGLTSENHRTTA